MSIVPEFAVRLLRNEGGRHQDPELTGTKSRDEARLCVHADAALGAVTLRLKREVQLDLIAQRPQRVVPNRITAAVTCSAREIVTGYAWGVHLPESRGAGFEAIWILPEVVVHGSEDRSSLS